ncbi:MAG: M1 family metallopeptidase [Bacteroidetes bacterium]|nr:M1 family metallopeptidase [Bacteroidota bacterium]MBS1648805.1 M1 family metallopeptidase [Bacteroidota bacterium]
MILLLRRTLVHIIILFSIIITNTTHAQLGINKSQYTHADTLRGSLNENRDWWNVLQYGITVKPDYENKTIEGEVIIVCEAIKNGKTLQIDLQQPLIIDSIINKGVLFSSKGETKQKHEVYKFTQIPTDNIAIVELNETKYKNEKFSFHIYYHGKPREAIRPPWDGGWIWKKDEKGRPWMSVAVQGLGASAWYPCKDYQGDEPDNGASLSIIVPDTLMAVGNGRLKSKIQIPNSNLMLYTWVVKNPINNYNIIPYIGKYVNFTDTLMGLKGKLDLSYWVLDYNLEKAKQQFKQAKLMLRAFEYWFGPYPFYEDSYKLVDAPHLGMEHQSAVAYGNKYQNGYLGRDLSGTGWGLKWDFIIVHESGHEWFANNITTKDIADMWVHEGFTNYSETLFTEYYYGKEAGTDYNVGTRRSIRNDIPIIGTYGVNKEGSGDMYYKGGNMLHTIRHSIDDDEKFRQILIGLNKTFYHQTVTTQQIENYISKQSKFDFSKVFNQYLRTTQIPTLEFYKDSITQTATLHYTNCVEGFDLPIVISSTHKKIIPTEKWQTIKLNTDEMQWFTKANIERMFYIKTKQLETKP